MMKVENLMKSPVRTCRADDPLNRATQLMWENDCGCVPVLGDGATVIGMLTDRDICMAAYTQGKQLADMSVASVMSKRVISCRPEDSLDAAEVAMRENQIRRLPVTDSAGQLKGILSLNDIARQAQGRRDKKKADVTVDEVATTLAAICRPHSSRALAATV